MPTQPKDDDDNNRRPDPLPFADSLCHRCAAPPRYITSGRGSVFILCPLWPTKYPPQPVRACPLFKPRDQ